MVVQHEQDTRAYEDHKRPKRQRSQIPGRTEAHHPLAHLCGEQVQEDVLLDRHRTMEGACARTAAENCSPHPRPPQLVEIALRHVRHGYTLTNCMGGISVERSTIRSPSSLIHIFFHGKGRGAGPSILSPGL